MIVELIIVLTQPNRLSVVSERAFELAGRPPGPAPRCVGSIILGIELDGLVIVGQCRSVPPCPYAARRGLQTREHPVGSRGSAS